VGSENPSGADNQQERPGLEQWIVGFVDGEGCFSCPIQRNSVMRIGWQLQPMFAVVQAERSLSVLELMQEFFGCGRIYRNRRHDNHREDLMVYQVFRYAELRDIIVPFFERYPLENGESRRLPEVRGDHRDDGQETPPERGGLDRHREDRRDDEPPKAVSFPGILRGHTPAGSLPMRESKIWSFPHGDMGRPKSEIPCQVSSDLHEWRNDLGTVSTRDSAKLQYE
jgi:LAGLIDADG endonuclease